MLVDYAHNRASFELLKEFLGQFPERKVGALDAAGDRSDDEIVALGHLAAATYDELFLYEDPDRRGRAAGEIVALLAPGRAARPASRAERLHRLADPEAAWPPPSRAAAPTPWS